MRNLYDIAEFEESCDKLILAPGAKPMTPPFPGLDSGKLFTLRTVEDTFRIREYIRGHHPKSAVLAGGGFRFYDAVMNDRALTERSTACGMDL